MARWISRAATREPAVDRRQPLFVPDSARHSQAYDARTGEELWSHNNGIGHNGGIISYGADGKQYVAVATGWGRSWATIPRAIRRAIQRTWRPIKAIS